MVGADRGSLPVAIIAVSPFRLAELLSLLFVLSMLLSLLLNTAAAAAAHVGTCCVPAFTHGLVLVLGCCSGSIIC